MSDYIWQTYVPATRKSSGWPLC